MSGLKGTKTEQNLLAALKGESMARNKYTYYAEIAKQEGNKELTDLFTRMANNECAHAKIWFRLINEGFKASEYNLQEAAKGENEEWRSMYPGFAATAREEGLEEIATSFDRVGQIERDHEFTFLKAYAGLKMAGSQTQNVEASKMKEKVVYRCAICGATSPDALQICNTCGASGFMEKGVAMVMD